ncbi:hypothetical protein ACOYR1_05990 [Thalassotalea piscium]
MKSNITNNSKKPIIIPNICALILYVIGYFLAMTFGEYFISSDTNPIVHIVIIIIFSLLLHAITKGEHLNDAGGGMAIIFLGAIIWGLIVWFYDENSIFNAFINILLTVVMFHTIIMKVKRLIEKQIKYLGYPIIISLIAVISFVLVKKHNNENPTEGSMSEFKAVYLSNDRNTFGYITTREAFDYHLLDLQKTVTVKVYGFYGIKKDGDYEQGKAVLLKAPCTYSTGLFSSKKVLIDDCPWYDGGGRRMSDLKESAYKQIQYEVTGKEHFLY